MKQFLPGIIILSLFTVIFSTNSLANKTENIYKKLSVQQCDSLIRANETNPNFAILDVRTPSQWGSDHLDGSINRNYYDTDFDEQLAALPKHKIFLIHCQSGGRSSGTFYKMQNQGFAEVYDMSGGISSWKSASLPTTSVIEPKLMLVSYEEITGGSNSDTLKITVTNRANDILSFNSVELFDVHDIHTNFNVENQLAGAEDYTFSIYHTPGYSESDSTHIQLFSNGGQINLSIIFENGVIQDTPFQPFNDLKIYPNPAKQYLEILSGNIHVFDEISIININGNIVFQKTNFDTNNRLNLEQLKNGIYFLRFRTGSEQQIEKIMINR